MDTMDVKYFIYHILPLLFILISSRILTVTGLHSCFIQENSPSGTNICDLSQMFPSLMLDNTKNSRLILDNFQNFFKIKNNKMLVLRRSLDREELITEKKCRLNQPIGNNNIFGSDNQCRLTLDFSTPSATFHQLILVVQDQNDNAPRFDRMTFILNVPENSPVNKEVELPQAVDPDRGNNGTLEYSLKKTKHSEKFTLKNSKMRNMGTNLRNNPLILQFRHTFDREALASDDPYSRRDAAQINLILLVKDNGTPRSLYANMTIQIDITDVNDNVPVFNSSQYRFTVSELVNQGQPIGQVFATDKDSSTNHLTIRMSPSASSDIADAFSVSSEGVITSKNGRLDYTQPNHDYLIPIIAVDGGVPPYTATTTAFIRVKDVNNNSPQIEVSPSGLGGEYLQLDTLLKTFAVMENCRPNTYVAKVIVSDADRGKNAEISCDLDPKTYFKLSSIPSSIPNRRYYKLSTSAGASSSADSQLFDREKNAHIKVRITCRDKGEPQPRITNKDLMIRVLDENDNAPEFSKSFKFLKVPENQHAGTQILKLYASDKDYGDNAIIRFKLIQTEADLLSPYNPIDYFKIDADTGSIFTMKQLDREEHDTFVLYVTAYDKKKPQLHNNITIKIKVTDENDNAPQFDMNKPIKFNISENTAGYVGRVEAKDADTDLNGQIEYYLQEYSSIFQVTRKGEIRVINKRKLDREKQPQHFLEVVARDLGRPSKRASVTVEIIVNDVNDNKPQFKRPATNQQFCNISVDTPPHAKIYQLMATDQDKGVNSEIEYSLYHVIPSGTLVSGKPGSQGHSLFRVNKTDGAIYLEGNLPREPSKRPRRLILMARDMGKPSLSSTATLTITYLTYNGAPNTGGNNNMIWNNNGKGYYDNDYKTRNQHSNMYPSNGDSYPEGIGGDKGPSNSGRGGSKGSREFILTIGIGMVVLIFFFLVMLISYFCVSIMLQKQKERRRELIHSKTSNAPSHQGLTNSTESRHHRHHGQWWTSMWTNTNSNNNNNPNKICCFNISADDDDNTHMGRVSLNNNNSSFYQNNSNNNPSTNNNSITNNNINNNDSGMLHRTLGRYDSQNAYSVMCDTASLQHWNFDQSHSNTLGNTPHFHSNINTPLALHPLRMSNATSTTNCNRNNTWQPNTSSQSDFDTNNVNPSNMNNNSNYSGNHGNNPDEINDEEDDGNYTYRHFTINNKHQPHNYWHTTIAPQHAQYYHTLQPQQQHCAPGQQQIIFTARQQPDIISASPPTISALQMTSGHLPGESNSSDEVNRIFYGAKTPTILCSSNNQILINSTRSPQLVTVPNSPQIHIQSQSIVTDDNQSKLNTNTLSFSGPNNNSDDNNTVYQTNPASVTPRIIANSFV